MLYTNLRLLPIRLVTVGRDNDTFDILADPIDPKQLSVPLQAELINFPLPNSFCILAMLRLRA